MKLTASEHAEQSAFHDWLDFKRIKHHAIPNGAYFGRDIKWRMIQITKLKKEGFSNGFPDMIIPYRTKEYGGLFVEMKKRGKKPDPDQIEWHEFLRGQGYQVLVCYSADEAIAGVIRYMNGSVNK